MRMMKPAIVSVLAAVVALATVDAQITVLPAERGEPMQLPSARQSKTGTGRIKGRLVTADTGAPVRRAQVRLTGSEIMPKVVTTDGEGTYEFRDLPAGRFTVNASKSGYVSVGYGQTRPFESPKPIELGDGQAVDQANITMPRGSAIAGRIVDEFGEPIADVVVSAMRSTWSNGRRRLQPTGRTATTNDLGQYRVYGLPPGEYFVTATQRGMAEMMVMEMERAVAAVRATMTEAADAPRSGYAPTYYPGTANGNEAQRLTLSLGQEATNADFGLVPVRLSRITGVVIGSDGRPAEGVMISATPRDATGSAGIFFPAGGSARTDRNGHFTLNGIAPGEYTLNARGVTIVQSGGDGDRQVFTMTRIVTGGEGSSESGSIPISVSGEDLANVVIATSKGTSVSGRVIYEGGAKPTANTLRISAPALDADNPLVAFGSSSSVSAEGTFQINGLAGPRTFRVSNVPAGWTLKAVRLNNADITDTGIDIRPTEPITGLDVVLTNRTTEVNGGVKAGNEPASDYTVVIFSEDPQKWLAPMPRHITSARPNQSGRFQVKQLPAGNYYAIAVDYIPQGDWNDPEVLDRLKTRATRFSLDEGEVKTIELTLEGM